LRLRVDRGRPSDLRLVDRRWRRSDLRLPIDRHGLGIGRIRRRRRVIFRAAPHAARERESNQQQDEEAVWPHARIRAPKVKPD
jgi:hypothetical protein